MNALENLFILSNGQEQGPYPAWQILQLWNEKVLNADTQCRREGSDSWQALGPLMPSDGQEENFPDDAPNGSASYSSSIEDAETEAESGATTESLPPLWKQILLWLAVVPGAVLGGWLGYIAIILMSWFCRLFGGEESGDWNFFVTQSMAHAALGYTFVLCGFSIAPSRKITVAITLAALALFLCSPSIFGSAFRYEWTNLSSLLCLVSASIVCAVKIAKGVDPLV